MSASDTAASAAAWFAENTPKDWMDVVDGLDDDGYAEFQRCWLKQLNQRGYAAPGVPKEWGGGGYGVREQAAIFRAWAQAAAPPVDLFEVSLNHVPGTFLMAGTQEQKERYVRPALDGVVWCQGFSEPGAGSDLAAITTAATRADGGWRVTGQKTWSSHAAQAEHCLLLARTGRGPRPHDGMTYFVLDMDQPGIEVRPIRQMHGAAEYCEIFLDGAFVRDDQVIGAVGDGWRVAQATLSAERGPMSLPTIERLGMALRGLLQQAGPPESALSAAQADLVRLLARQSAVRSLALDTVDLMERGLDSGSLASLIKISFSELLEEVTSLAGSLNAEQTLLDPGSRHFLGYVSGRWATDWLGSWAATIAGGANEIQRGIVAQRLLGLPREPRPATAGASS